MDTQQWFPVVTLVLGLILGYVGDWLRDERTARRERETRRKQFQRETIIEVQDLMGSRLRAEWGFAGELVRKYESEGRWLKDDAYRFAQPALIESIDRALRLIALEPRIEDEELAKLVSDIVIHSTGMTDGPDSEASYKAMTETAQDIRRFHRRAETVLAELH